MAKQPTDDEQNLKRKSRRRLVGAVALALAVIVILPMVLDSEPKPTGQDIDLRIPAPDAAGEFLPKVMPPKVAAALPASSPVVVTPVELAVTPVAVDTKSAEKTEKPTVAEAIVVQPKAVPAKADPKPAAKETTPTPSSTTESFVAQVGAYSKAESAHKVLTELKGWSFKAYSEKVGDKIRVRVGPYAEKDKAEKVIMLLEKHGLKPALVTLP
jgi:DedD protein